MKKQLSPTHRLLPIKAHAPILADAIPSSNHPCNISTGHLTVSDDPLSPQQREGSFDKIIGRYEPRNGKENSPGRDSKGRQGVGRQGPKAADCGRPCLNGNSQTERIRENLAKLRSHYCFLPEIGALRQRRPTVEAEFGEDYERFERGERKDGQRKPLGFLKIGKLKYQKSMVFLNQ